MASWSGVGRYTNGLARALAARDDIDLVQAITLGTEPPVPEARARAVPVGGHPFSPLGAHALAIAISRVSPDITHCAHFPTPFPVRCPLVVTLHDLEPLLIEGTMPSWIARMVYRWWNARAVRVADRIICPSRNTFADVVRLFPRADGRTRVTLEAADDFAQGPVGSLPSWLDGECYILSMGNTKPHKDLPTLLHAFSQLAEYYPSVLLVLVGREPVGYVQSVLARDDPAVERIRFTGSVDDATLRALYAKAALFAFPSLYEGFGLPPLEAMALGCPVVCSSAASLPEVVGDAALLVPAGDVDGFATAIRRVLEDSELRDRLVAAGHAHAAALSWARTAEETVAVYSEVVASSSC